MQQHALPEKKTAIIFSDNSPLPMCICRCSASSAAFPCVWDYTATGIEYEFLAGPAFTLVFTMAAIPLGVLAGHPVVNRKIGLSVCLVLWSTMTLLAGFTSAFWQLLLTRLGLGIL